jgi:hypothetical protein
VERIAGSVNDRLEELIPGPGGRREAGELMQEPELLELVRSAPLVDLGRRHGRHDTSLRAQAAVEGCGGGPRGLRNGRAATFAGAVPP